MYQGRLLTQFAKSLYLPPAAFAKPPIFFRAPQIFPQFGAASATGALAAEGAVSAALWNSATSSAVKSDRNALASASLLFSRAERDSYIWASCAAGRPEGVAVAAVAAGAAMPTATAAMVVAAAMRKRL